MRDALGGRYWPTEKALRALGEVEVAEVTSLTARQLAAIQGAGYDVFLVDAAPLLGLVPA